MVQDKKSVEKNTIKKSKQKAVWRSAFWIAAWSVVAGIPLFIIMIALLGAVALPSLESHGTDATGQQIIGLEALMPIARFILLGVAIAVIALSVLKWYLKTRNKPFWRTGGTILGGYIWLGVLVGGLVMLATIGEFSSIKPAVAVEKNIEQSLHAIGAKDELLKDVSMVYVSSFENPEVAGTYQPSFTTDGWFSHGTISIKSDIDKDYLNTVVAHEYLHHIWAAHMDYATQRSLASEVITLYGKDAWMQERVASYSSGHILDPGELFAFYCTEVSDSHLTQPVLSQCEALIDRTALTTV